MEKENELSHVSKINCSELLFQDVVNIVNNSNSIQQCLLLLKDIVNDGSIEQIANFAFNILEKYTLTTKQEETLYELSLMTAGEEGEFDLSREEIITKVDSLLLSCTEYDGSFVI